MACWECQRGYGQDDCALRVVNLPPHICVLSTHQAEKPQTSRGLESLKLLLRTMRRTHIFNRTLRAAFDQDVGIKSALKEKPEPLAHCQS